MRGVCRRHLSGALVVAFGISAGLVAQVSAGKPNVTRIVYDSFDGDYDLGDYLTKWNNGFGPGEMAIDDTRDFDGSSFSVSALPFQTAADFSVFDHIKYLALSNQSFAVPEKGSVTFSTTIDATVVGTTPAGRVIHGVYGGPGCADDPVCAAGAEPWEGVALEGQQAGATLHMIDFATGQLFDWFVSGSTAFALVERLPATVDRVADRWHTRHDVHPDRQGSRRSVTARTRWRSRSSAIAGRSYVDFTLDGVRVARVKKVGVPLDVQKAAYTGIYPSLGAGEQLGSQIDSVAIGHGLFSLLDAFPFQHPDAPELSVSIPISERIFGQGAGATFDDFVVTIDDRG